MELESVAIELLERIGIRKGQTILDFGCGSGTYTIPAAKIVGQQGRVYALDQDKEALDELMKKVVSADLSSIERMEASDKSGIELNDESVDIVLLFDVFHLYYFPERDDRRRLLGEIYRIMKPNAFVSVWPKHMEAEAEDCIKNANFNLGEELWETLIHNDKNLEKGKILNLRKRLRNRYEC